MILSSASCPECLRPFTPESVDVLDTLIRAGKSDFVHVCPLCGERLKIKVNVEIKKEEDLFND